MISNFCVKYDSNIAKFVFNREFDIQDSRYFNIVDVSESFDDEFLCLNWEEFLHIKRRILSSSIIDDSQFVTMASRGRIVKLERIGATYNLRVDHEQISGLVSDWEIIDCSFQKLIQILFDLNNKNKHD